MLMLTTPTTNAILKLNYLLGFLIISLICECDEQQAEIASFAKSTPKQRGELPLCIVCWFHCVIYNTLWCLPLNFVRYKHKLRNVKISKLYSLAFERFLSPSVVAEEKTALEGKRILCTKLPRNACEHLDTSLAPRG